MFMINYELVYGKQVLQSTVLSSYESAQHRTASASDDVQISSTDDMHSEEISHQRGSFKDRLMGAAGAAAVVAGGLAKGAVEAAKSEETAARAAAFKAKAHAVANGVGTSVSEIGDKAAGFVSSHRTKPSSAQADVYGIEEQSSEEFEVQKQVLLSEEYESDEGIDEEPADSFADVEHMPRHNQAPRSVHYSETVFTRTYGNDSWESAEGIRNQSTKKSVVVGIISGLSVCIIFAGGLFGGMYLMKNKEKDISQGQQSRSENEKLESTSDPGSNVTTTSSSDMFQSPASTTSESKGTTAIDSESTIGTEVQTTTNIIFYEMYEAASIRALEHFMLDNSFNDSVMYGLCDINADGVPELLINYATEADDMTSMYIFFETDYRQAVSFGGSAEICAAQHLIQSFGYGGASVRKIFEMDARGNISSKDELYEEYISVDTMYYALNSIEIGKAQYDELNEYYDSLKWEYVCNTEYRRSAIEMPSDSTKDPYAAIKQEILDSVDNEYYRGGNSHLENAPADMVFYAAADRTWINISNAEILEGPDVNYASCIAYTSSFQLIGENTNWYYVMWIEGVGAFTHPCYGFIRKVV